MNDIQLLAMQYQDRRLERYQRESRRRRGSRARAARIRRENDEGLR